MKSIFLVLLISLFAIACGGGGGGGSSSDPLSNYSGKTAPAEINEETTDEVSSVASDVSTSDSSAADSVLNERDSSVSFKGKVGHLSKGMSQEKNSLRETLIEIKQNTNRKKQRSSSDSDDASLVVDVSKIVRSDGEGGTYVIDYTNYDIENEKGLVSKIYSDFNYYAYYRNSDYYYGYYYANSGNLILNGTVNYNITEQSDYNVDDFSIEYVNFMEEETYGDYNYFYSIMGTIDIDTDREEKSMVITRNLSYNFSNETQNRVYKNYIKELTFYDSSLYRIKSNKTNGELYLYDHGLLDIEMNEPFMYLKGSTYPSYGGPLILTGEANSIAKFESNGSSMKISYDKDGDNDFEEIKVYDYSFYGLVETEKTEEEFDQLVEQNVFDGEGREIELEEMVSVPGTPDFYQTLDNGEDFVFSSEGNLYLYDSSSNLLSSMSLDEGVDADDLSVTPNGNVLGIGDDRMVKYDIVNSVSEIYETVDQFKSIASIDEDTCFALTDTELILVDYEQGLEMTTLVEEETNYSAKIKYNSYSNKLFFYTSNYYYDIYSFDGVGVSEIVSNVYSYRDILGFLRDGFRFYDVNGLYNMYTSDQAGDFYDRVEDSYYSIYSYYGGYSYNYGYNYLEVISEDPNLNFLYTLIIDSGEYNLSVYDEDTLEHYVKYVFDDFESQDHDPKLLSIPLGNLDEFYLLSKSRSSSDSSFSYETVIFRAKLSSGISNSYTSRQEESVYDDADFFDFHFKDVVYSDSENDIYVITEDSNLVEVSLSTNIIQKTQLANEVNSLKISGSGNKLVMNSSNLIQVFDAEDKSLISDYLDFVPEDFDLNDNYVYLLSDTVTDSIQRLPTNFTSVASMMTYTFTDTFYKIDINKSGDKALIQRSSYLDVFDLSTGSPSHLYDEYFFGDIINIVEKNGVDYTLEEDSVIYKIEQDELDYEGRIYSYSYYGDRIETADYSSELDYLAFIKKDNYYSDDNQIEIYGFSDLDYKGSYELPSYQINNKSFSVNAKACYFSEDSKYLYIIFSISSSSGLKYNEGRLTVKVEDLLED